MPAALVLATALTVWAVVEAAINIMREERYPPWGLYLLWFSLLAMLWSGLSLLRRRTNLAIFVLLLSAVYALPLGMLTILLAFGD
jgi:predicted Na+-dependent transporter